MTGVEPANHSTGTLPGWSSVLAVVAHPDDESFGLGAILDSFGRGGSQVSVLCLTHGEASTLGAAGDLGMLGRRTADRGQGARRRLGRPARPSRWRAE